ncbi:MULTISPECIES: hypothetical protein [unclassified Bradyrhizobium]|uniref:hypothetical protein n=1 Tax=unclassified Bradyrhizobium TaxID=2631580 RepID=UPI0029168773|nr:MULTISPECIES: hypothetical protein [unclassified Bradyrhizobium]
MQTPCRDCGGFTSILDEGKAQHLAALRCKACRRWRHWLSGQDAVTLLEMQDTVVKRLGQRPSFNLKDIKEHTAAASSAAVAVSHTRAQNGNEPMTTNDFDALYGSKYLGAADLSGQVIRRKIGLVEQVTLKQRDGMTKRKLAVHFDGCDKALPLNQTNASALAAVLGKDTSKWTGAAVELYTEQTTYGPGVRVRPISAAPSKNEPAPKQTDEFDDEDIPF